MIKETGTVVAIEQDGLWVETLKQSACASCAAKHGCGQKLFNDSSAATGMTLIKVLFTGESRKVGWRIGDSAVLGVEELSLVYGALVAYGLPLILMLLGMLAASLWIAPDLGDVSAVGGAFVGLIVGGVAARVHSAINKNRSCYQAFVLGKVISSDIQ